MFFAPWNIDAILRLLLTPFARCDSFQLFLALLLISKKKTRTGPAALPRSDKILNTECSQCQICHQTSQRKCKNMSAYKTFLPPSAALHMSAQQRQSTDIVSQHLRISIAPAPIKTLELHFEAFKLNTTTLPTQNL